MRRFYISTLLWLTLVAGLATAWHRERVRLGEAKEQLQERDKVIARQKEALESTRDKYPYYTTRGPRDLFSNNPN